MYMNLVADFSVLDVENDDFAEHVVHHGFGLFDVVLHLEGFAGLGDFFDVIAGLNRGVISSVNRQPMQYRMNYWCNYLLDGGIEVAVDDAGSLGVFGGQVAEEFSDGDEDGFFHDGGEFNTGSVDVDLLSRFPEKMSIR